MPCALAVGVAGALWLCVPLAVAWCAGMTNASLLAAGGQLQVAQSSSFKELKMIRDLILKMIRNLVWLQPYVKNVSKNDVGIKFEHSQAPVCYFPKHSPDTC